VVTGASSFGNAPAGAQQSVGLAEQEQAKAKGDGRLIVVGRDNRLSDGAEELIA